MPFTRPTLTELVDRIQGDIEVHVNSGQSLLRRSVLKVLARVFAGAVHLLYGYLSFKSEQLFITTADVEGLETHADEYGISRTAAAKASGSIQVTGTIGATIPAGTQFQTADGTLYASNTETTIVASPQSIEVTAVEGGVDANQEAGAALSFISPIAGISTQCTVGTGGITGGTDEETDDELREKVLLRKQYPPFGGCEYDYKNWILEYSGVTRAWVFPTYKGAGTVGCAFVMDNASPYIPNSSVMDLVKAYLIQHKDPATGRIVGIPVTAIPGLEMISLSELLVNISLKIYPNTSTVQTNISDELDELISRKGGPGKTLYLSDIQAALGRVSELEYFNIVSPVSDITALTNQIHALGTITYEGY